MRRENEMDMLTIGERVIALLQIGILIALWGIYSEVRRYVASLSDND
jgi:hypothetical protein